jgi:hypothetical protein
MYPALPKSYKGVYPFKLGTTSFIYPAGYTQNVTMLAPYVDEIELLLFESAPDSLPSTQEIKKLLSLSKEFDLTYNVHLPFDISLSDPEPSIRRAATETLKKVIDFTASLCPSTYTLHLSYDEKRSEAEYIKKWQERLYRSVGHFIATGVIPEMISVEILWNGWNISLTILTCPCVWIWGISCYTGSIWKPCSTGIATEPRSFIFTGSKIIRIIYH